MAKASGPKRGARQAAKPKKRATSAPPKLDPDIQRMRERLDELENQARELRAANEELSQERAELRERAGIIEQRYSELLERTVNAQAGTALSVNLQALRGELDEPRRRRDAIGRTESFWMVCPKCGGTLEEIDHCGVKVDRCRSCSGVYLDRGELEVLASTGEGSGFFISIRSLFG
jgi:hypothetical protein